MHIGYDPNTGHVYEGANLPEYPVVPTPLLTQAVLVESPAKLADLPRGLHDDPFAWVIREVSFDPVMRVMRGRLYEPSSNAQPAMCKTRGHAADQYRASPEPLNKNLYRYWPCQSLLQKPRRGSGLTLAVGRKDAWTTWRIVQVMRLIDDDVLVTLRSLAAFGLLPDIDSDAIPSAHRASVQAAIERVLDTAFRETAISVIDQCRNAATVLLSRWLASKGSEQSVLALDLGALVKELQQKPHERRAAASAADLVRLLHPRGKANEQEQRGLRLPQEEDAEAAVHAVGFILREFGWVR